MPKGKGTYGTKKGRPPKKKDGYIFVLQLHNGQLVIGQASNPCRRIAAINSGMNRAIQESLQINKIIGVKEITRTRNLMTVVKKFCDRYGSGRIITVLAQTN